MHVTRVEPTTSSYTTDFFCMKLGCFRRLLDAAAFSFVALTVGGCDGQRTMAPVPTDNGVAAVPQKQADRWNAGDLEGFMQTYARSPQTRFASGGTVNMGWDSVMARYRSKYGDRAAMGTLTFSNLAI